MFEHALRSASSSQALIACSHLYHVNLWRSRTVDTPRIRRVRGHRIPEYQRAPRQHDELRRDYYRLYRLPFCRRSGSYCYEDPRVQSYLRQMCTKRQSPLIDTNTAVCTRNDLLVEGNLKPRRLWLIVTGAVTRWRNQALIHCWRPPGVHYNSIKSLVPYTERQMAQLSISFQQPGDSTSPSTFGHTA